MNYASSHQRKEKMRRETPQSALVARLKKTSYLNKQFAAAGWMLPLSARVNHEKETHSARFSEFWFHTDDCSCLPFSSLGSPVGGDLQSDNGNKETEGLSFKSPNEPQTNSLIVFALSWTKVPLSLQSPAKPQRFDCLTYTVRVRLPGWDAVRATIVIRRYLPLKSGHEKLTVPSATAAWLPPFLARWAETGQMRPSNSNASSIWSHVLSVTISCIYLYIYISIYLYIYISIYL